MTGRYLQGVLDASVVIDLDEIPEESLPVHAAIGAVTPAELSQGPHLATDAETRAVRIERLQFVEATFPLAAAVQRCMRAEVRLACRQGHGGGPEPETQAYRPDDRGNRRKRRSPPIHAESRRLQGDRVVRLRRARLMRIA